MRDGRPDPRDGKVAVYIDPDKPAETIHLALGLLRDAIKAVPAKLIAVKSQLDIAEAGEIANWIIDLEEEIKARPEPEAAE